MLRSRKMNGKMAREKRSKQQKYQIRHLTKIAGGSSYAIVIPMDFVKKLGWKDHQKLTLHLYGKKVVIGDWEPEGD